MGTGVVREEERQAKGFVVMQCANTKLIEFFVALALSLLPTLALSLSLALFVCPALWHFVQVSNRKSQPLSALAWPIRATILASHSIVLGAVYFAFIFVLLFALPKNIISI